MDITVNQLKAIMPMCKAKADLYVVLMNRYASEYGITTPLRWAHFLSQIAVESCELKCTEENLNYSAAGLLKVFPKYFSATQAGECAKQPKKIANVVYANRMGNGNAASGEGYKYRGRTFIQLTGKDNYKEYQTHRHERGLADSCVENPDLLLRPVETVRCSMWYWQKRGLSAIADKDDCIMVTKRINGGTNGLAQRQKYLVRAKRAFGLIK